MSYKNITITAERKKAKLEKIRLQHYENKITYFDRKHKKDLITGMQLKINGVKHNPNPS